MAKQPPRKIGSPGPTGRMLDTSALEAMLRERCEFDGEETLVLFDVATAWATEAGIPVKQAVTMAWSAYWRLHDERA